MDCNMGEAAAEEEEEQGIEKQKQNRGEWFVARRKGKEKDMSEL